MNKKPQHKLREIHFEFDEFNKDFRCYKIWSRKSQIKDPFLILDSVEELVDNLETLQKKYQCRIDYKKLKKYIEKYSEN